jgi:hypothetical protein
MKVLARFPALESVATTVCAEDARPAMAPGSPDLATDPPPDAAPRRRGRGRFPGWSVTSLAILAAIVWSLAAWNDARRLEQHRLERLAAGRVPAVDRGTVSR